MLPGCLPHLRWTERGIMWTKNPLKDKILMSQSWMMTMKNDSLLPWMHSWHFQSTPAAFNPPSRPVSDNSDCILGLTTMENSCNIPSQAAHRLYPIGVREPPTTTPACIKFIVDDEAFFFFFPLIVIVNSLRTYLDSYVEPCFSLSIWTQWHINMMSLLAAKHCCRPNKNIRHRDSKYNTVSHIIQLRNSCSCQTQEADKKYCILFG